MRRSLAALLVLTLVFALFCGCSGSGKDTSAEGTSPAAATENTPAATGGAAAAQENAPAATASASVYPLTDEVVTFSCLTLTPDANKTVDNPDMFEYYDIAEKVTGVKIEWDCVNAEAMRVNLNVVMASGDLPDMVNATASILAGGLEYNVSQGLVCDIGDLVERYAPEYCDLVMSNDDIYRNTTDSRGRINAFWTIYEYSPYEWGSFARADWMEDLGYKSLTTYDDWHNFLLAAKNKYDLSHALLLGGNGVIFYSLLAGGYGVSAYATDDAYSQFYKVGDTVHSSLAEQGYREYLAMLHQWYAEGIVSADFLSVPSIPFVPDRENMMLSGSAIFASNINMMDYYNAAGADEGYRIVGIADAVKAKGDTIHFTKVTMYNKNAYCYITSACKKPEIAVAFLNYFYTDEGKLGYNYGVEGKTYKLEKGEVVLTDLVMKDPEFDPSNAIYLYSGSNQMPGLVDAKRYTRFFSADTKATADAWLSGCDDAYYLPALSVSNEKYPDFESTLTEMNTYAGENVLGFITGAKSLETDWDAYVAQLKKMGLDDVVSTYQKVYDAYMSK